jgi:hypothetical protein
MLTGMALDHFLSYQLTESNPTFKRVCEHMHGFFEGPEWQRLQKVKWQNTTLYQVMNDNPDSTTPAKKLGRFLLTQPPRARINNAPILNFKQP